MDPAQHSGLPVAGYTTQPADRVDLVNQNKEIEERVMRQIDRLAGKSPSGTLDSSEFDQRMVALARTKAQEAFMWLNRAVFQPQRIALPEDEGKQA